jgi:multisubunit Na+/H+ antiporter MnhB subunit
MWKNLGGAITTLVVIYLTIKLRHPERLKWSVGLRNFMLVLVILFVIWFIFFVISPIIKGTY